jgi:hypothetical protein
MFTSPSVDDLLDGLISALQDDIVPNVTNAKAYATALMMQSVIQQIRQVLPVQAGYLVDEHNAMTKVLRDTADALGHAAGDEADRVRARAAELGDRADLPTPLATDALASAHRELTSAIVANMTDLDVLQRAGDERADASLRVMRAHLGPRYVRDVQTVIVGAGMIGRG